MLAAKSCESAFSIFYSNQGWCESRMVADNKLKVEVKRPKTKKGRLALKAREPKEVRSYMCVCVMHLEAMVHS